MKISLIVPVYNAEATLPRLMDFLFAQTFLKTHRGQMEILLINNNSTDNSKALIKSFAEKRPNLIKAYDYQTPGAAATRNFGVQQAQGKYIWFIDADDYIIETAVEQLITAAETINPKTKQTADLTLFAAKRLFTHRPTIVLPALDPKARDFKSRFVRYGFGPWQFLIRRDWWLAHDLDFPEGIIHEDMALMSALILYTDNFAVVDEPLYCYLENDSSVLHSDTKTASCLDIFPALDYLYQKFVSENAVETYFYELEYFYIWNLLLDSARDFKNYTDGATGFHKTREILKSRFPHWRRNPFFKQKSLLFRLRCRLSYHGIVISRRPPHGVSS